MINLNMNLTLIFKMKKFKPQLKLILQEQSITNSIEYVVYNLFELAFTA